MKNLKTGHGWRRYFCTFQGPNLEPFIDRTFRGGTTSADDFQLSVLTNRHPDYKSRKEQFLQKWEKPFAGTGVSVLRMFKVKVRCTRV